MQQFIGAGKVVLTHDLWGRQNFLCENIQFIDDKERVGVIIHGQQIFVYKTDIVQETDHMVSDGRLSIYVTKL